MLLFFDVCFGALFLSSNGSCGALDDMMCLSHLYVTEVIHTSVTAIYTVYINYVKTTLNMIKTEITK